MIYEGDSNTPAQQSLHNFRFYTSKLILLAKRQLRVGMFSPVAGIVVPYFRRIFIDVEAAASLQ
jgi:hypothetical protein